MEPTYAPQRLPCILLVLFLMSFNTFCNADLNKDREKCATQLVGLAGCLPYVGGDAKSPAADCCSGLNEVLQKSKECLCILIKDRNDPSLNLKINATLALGLPEKCHAPANISDCPALLHLAPNSPDAKVFEDFAKSGNGSSSSAPAQEGSSNTGNGSSSNVKSDGGKRIGWPKTEMIFGLFIIMVFHVLSNF